MPSLGLAHPRARFRFDRLTPAALARIAHAPSYLAPRAADLHDPTTFRPPTGPYDSDELTGRAFIANGTIRPRVRLVAVQPFMGELAACPHLTTLRRLDLSGNRIGPDGMRALAGSPYLGELRELGLNGNVIGGNGAISLMGTAWLACLTQLELADNGLSSEDIAGLLLLAPDITELDVSGNHFDQTALPLTARALNRLAAARCDLGPDGVAYYCSDDRNARYESLDLRHNRLGYQGFVRLVGGGPFPALTRLDLGFNDTCDAVPLVELPALRTLGLRANRLVAPALAHPAVEELDLSVNPLADHVAVVAGFPNLVRLDLSNTTLTDDGLGRLLRALPTTLRALSLAWNSIGDDAALALAAWPGLAALDTLDLTGTRIGRRGASALAGRFGTIPA